MIRTVRIAAIALVAALTMAAGKPTSNWLKTVKITENGGHVLGNPEADVKLTEYVSYTCSHCGNFHREADGALKLAYVMPGKVSVEIQHIVRDPVDLTVALLTNCGETKGFFQRHNDFMAGQDKWLGKIGSTTQAQQARWYSGTIAARMQAIAHDFDFYPIMEKRGFSRADVNRCLGDNAKAIMITNQGTQASELGVEATPSFALDGTLLADTHKWNDLNKLLAARF
ncbi:MAG: thioredoxin domain-containing protein [Novosphingobium sp.]|nr:thioredoxin domain-containing protein [Novosphingobium sp.]